MQVRAGGAVANIGLNAVFIFGLEWGVAGAALGTVLSNVAVTATFAAGICAGRIPGIGAFPVRVDPFGAYLDGETLRDLVTIGLPVGGRNLVWTVAEFPMLGILDIFGENTVAAFVIARRIWGVMNAPGWGFGLASSSLVGQALGKNDEVTAKAYGRDIIRFAVATYVVSAILIALFAEQIVVLFAEDPTSAEIPIAIDLVYAACVAVVFQGVASAAAGRLTRAVIRACRSRASFSECSVARFHWRISAQPPDSATGAVSGVSRRDDRPGGDQLLALSHRQVESD